MLRRNKCVRCTAIACRGTRAERLGLASFTRYGISWLKESAADTQGTRGAEHTRTQPKCADGLFSIDVAECVYFIRWPNDSKNWEFVDSFRAPTVGHVGFIYYAMELPPTTLQHRTNRFVISFLYGPWWQGCPPLSNETKRSISHAEHLDQRLLWQEPYLLTRSQ